MERQVIIVSMVRNNNQRNIGFAKTPERLNVAFSRAQELLVIIGCYSLFTKFTKTIYQPLSLFFIFDVLENSFRIQAREEKKVLEDASTWLTNFITEDKSVCYSKTLGFCNHPQFSRYCSRYEHIRNRVRILFLPLGVNNKSLNLKNNRENGF